MARVVSPGEFILLTTTDLSATGLKACVYEVQVRGEGKDAEIWVEAPRSAAEEGESTLFGREWELVDIRGVSEGTPRLRSRYGFTADCMQSLRIRLSLHWQACRSLIPRPKRVPLEDRILWDPQRPCQKNCQTRCLPSPTWSWPQQTPNSSVF